MPLSLVIKDLQDKLVLGADYASLKCAHDPVTILTITCK